MIVPVAIALVIVGVGVRYRTLAPLADIRLRAAWLVWSAIGLQVLLIEVLPASTPAAIAVGLHLASYVAGLGFVWKNRAWLGIVVLGVGGALNLLVISLNDGVMPASAGAVDAAGLVHDDSFQNSAPVDDAVLAPLGDVFAVPDPLPLANVFSIGDVLIVVGAGVLVGAACRRARLAEANRPGDAFDVALHGSKVDVTE